MADFRSQKTGNFTKQCPGCGKWFSPSSLSNWILACPWCNGHNGMCWECHHYQHKPECWDAYKAKRKAADKSASWTF